MKATQFKVNSGLAITVWLRQLTAELGSLPEMATAIHLGRQQLAIAMTKNPQFHGQVKHIAIYYL